MNTKFLALQSAADSVIADPTNRSKVLGAAIALAVAAIGNLPTSPVDNVAEHYAHQVATDARRWVGEFNEQFVIDSKAVADQARTYWMLRYTAAHPLTVPVYSLNKGHGFFDAIIGVGLYVDDDQYALLNKHRSQILALAAHAQATIAALIERNANV